MIHSKWRKRTLVVLAFALILCWDLPYTAGSETSKSKQAGSAGTQTSRKKTRRHRRLKISRSRKPMPPLSEAPFGIEVTLLPVIEEAKSKLEKETVHYYAGSRKQPSRREIKLALANFKTAEIQIVSGTEKGQQLTLDNPNVHFKVEWWNGFNSSITILEPSKTAVVAILYALEPDRQRFLEQDAIIYTPYSSALLQTELVEAGKNYLLEKIAQARKGLGTVESRAFPGLPLSDSPAFSTDDYFNLILTSKWIRDAFVPLRLVNGSSTTSRYQN